MNKIFVALAIIGLVITCIFAVREPMSLLFIIPAFVVVGSGFIKIAEKAEFNRRLSKSEIVWTLRFCSVGFLVVSLAVNVGFLCWINSTTPLWGEEYQVRQNYEQIMEKARDEERENMRSISIAEVSVKGLLKDPSSAEFSGEKVVERNNVCGFVNAKNSFEAFSGKSRYVFNGAAYIDDGSKYFSNIWRATCL